ncbi:hybrid sensor histidine kinase/response regulator [Photobacterium sanctipauli]|uniref:Sensory/regulatory protein RpfC n=1 Tax=Photobacterium sanctipauli TaxID=1342794 RepID=A0A2T3NIE6_9GAMM|nr:ATP-binding protein [Photobacterium sanctipauli]PSW14802.1 hybrid sensor histidine kinase/response regulator [Photobacterium sanctipauli]
MKVTQSQQTNTIKATSIKRLLTYGAGIILVFLGAFFYADQKLNAQRGQLISLNADILTASNEMLMMRRHEKDFIARVDAKYQEKMATAYQDLLQSLEAISLSIALNNIDTSYDPQATLDSIKAYNQKFSALADVVLLIHGQGEQQGLIDALKDDSLALKNDIINTNNSTLDRLTLNTEDLMFQFFSDFDEGILEQITITLGNIEQEIISTSGKDSTAYEHFIGFESTFYSLQSAYKDFGYDHNSGRHGDLRETIHVLEDKLNTLFSETPALINAKLNVFELYLLIAAFTLAFSVIAVLVYVVHHIGKMETALINAREQEKQANKAKSAFLANMSHEIRTPLNGILGMTEILSDSKLSAIQKDYLSTINVSSQTLLMLINDILDLSKIESGHLEICPHTSAIKEIIFDTAALITPKAQQKSIDIVVDLDNNLPNYIKADEQKVRQVLMNLASNAIKFTEQGAITFTAHQVSETDSSVVIYFAVTDTGIGIDEDKQAHIFDEFRQENADTSAQYGGTGLGLAISSKMIELMGGEIKIKSAKGTGSQFYFEVEFSKDDQTLNQDNLFTIAYCTTSPNPLLVAELARFGYQYSIIDGNTSLIADIDQDALVIVDSPIILKAVEQQKPKHRVVYIRDNTKNIDIDSNHVVAFVTAPLFGMRLSNTLKNAYENDHADEVTQQQPQRPTSSTSQKILVVEDNKVNQQVVCINLKRMGLEYIIANNGQEAVDIYQTEHDAIGLILMDCMMPVMDGFGATEAIREHEASNQLPRKHIIALTASILDDDIQKCFDSGMDDYLPKPFKRDVLLEKLDKQVSLLS